MEWEDFSYFILTSDNLQDEITKEKFGLIMRKRVPGHHKTEEGDAEMGKGLSLGPHSAQKQEELMTSQH